MFGARDPRIGLPMLRIEPFHDILNRSPYLVDLLALPRHFSRPVARLENVTKRRVALEFLDSLERAEVKELED